MPTAGTRLAAPRRSLRAVHPREQSHDRMCGAAGVNSSEHLMQVCQNIAWMIPTVRARCGSERSARWATASSTRASAPVSGR